MARPSDWSPVGMEGDPTPGDPEQVRELAEELQTFSDDVAEALGRVRALASDRAVRDWAGLSAEAFRDEFDGVPGNLEKLRDSYNLCAQALNAYWPTLQTAQGQADRALDRAIAAQADLTAAQGSLSSATDWVTRAGEEAERLQREGEREGAPPPDEAEIRAATRDRQAADEARAAAQAQVNTAQASLDAARELARQAKEMREEAARQAARDIDEASDAGIHNRRWWEDAVHWVTENWDTIVDIARVVVAVLGIVVMIIGGPLAWVVLAAALVVLTDTLIRYARGQAGLLDVAFAALDCIPGMKGLTTLGGLAAGLRGLTRIGLRGMAQGVRGLATRGRALLADGMEAAYGRARSAIRSTGTDPVDLATGQMYLTQTDVELPGTLPFAFVRRVQSGYRAGGWFGPSWSSTCDQRLEIDADGVVFLGEDGIVAAYPHPPESGEPVTAGCGPPRPLASDGAGGYVLTDASRNRTLRFAAPGPGESGTRTALLTGIRDRNGNSVTFTYRPDGTPVAIDHSGGYRLLLTAEDGRVTSLSLADSSGGPSGIPLRRYSYDQDGNLTRITNASGKALTLAYDHRFRVTRWTDSNGRSYSYRYDSRDRCVEEGGAAGHLHLTLAYDTTDSRLPGGRVTRLTTATGAVSRFLIDDAFRVTAERDPLGAVTRTGYDSRHRVVSRTDPTGATTRFLPADSGDGGAVVEPDGATTLIRTEESGRRVVRETPDGAVEVDEYDAAGNRTATTDPLGARTGFAYDAAGRLVSVTDPLGAVTRVRCDAAGLPVEVTDPLGHRRTVRRDAFGRPVEITDATGAVTRLVWTPDGLLSRATRPDGGTESWEYDGEGNCVRHTDVLGGTTEFTYGHFDLLAARTAPDGTRHGFAHDAALRLTSVTDPLGNRWTYAYDAAGRLAAETDFAGRRTVYERDAAGRPVLRRNAAGQTVAYAYDAAGRLVRKESGGAVTRFSYDRAGRMVRATGPHGETVWTRDRAGRITAETVNGRTMTFRYDQAGRRVERVTPSGVRTTQEHDASGRVRTTTTGGRTFTFATDAAGREVTRLLDGAPLLSQEWDAAGRLAAQHIARPDGGRRDRSWTYRPDDRPVTLGDSDLGPTAFGLDTAGRVTRVGAADWEERYAYDGAGDQLFADWPPTSPDPAARGTRAYDRTQLVRAGAVRYTYDAAGRVVTRTHRTLSGQARTWRCTWDAEDRLTSFTDADGTVWQYVYDPFGRRTAKRRLADGGAACEETVFAWDGSQVAEETTVVTGEPGETILTWDHAGLRPLAQVERRTVGGDGGGTDARFFAIIADPVGTPYELIDDRGEVAWAARATLWGITGWNPGAAAWTPLRFPGQYHDRESGLHYNLHRYYDPDVGRYLSPDPFGLGPSPHPMAYVSHPLVLSDPYGLAPYRDFAHGTSPLHAETILRVGINADYGRAATHGGTMSRPGSFFTHEVTDSASHGLQLAYEWGLRSADDPHILIGRLSETTYQQLLDKGLITLREVTEQAPYETIFHPDSFETLNNEMRWVGRVKPHGR